MLKKSLAIIVAGIVTFICSLSILAAWETMPALELIGATIAAAALIFAAVFLAWNVESDDQR